MKRSECHNSSSKLACLWNLFFFSNKWKSGQIQDSIAANEAGIQTCVLYHHQGCLLFETLQRLYKDRWRMRQGWRRKLNKSPRQISEFYCSAIPKLSPTPPMQRGVLGLSVIIRVTKHLVGRKLKGGRVSFVSHSESQIHPWRDVIE